MSLPPAHSIDSYPPLPSFKLQHSPKTKLPSHNILRHRHPAFSFNSLHYNNISLPSPLKCPLTLPSKIHHRHSLPSSHSTTTTAPHHHRLNSATIATPSFPRTLHHQRPARHPELPQDTHPTVTRTMNYIYVLARYTPLALPSSGHNTRHNNPWFYLFWYFFYVFVLTWTPEAIRWTSGKIKIKKLNNIITELATQCNHNK